MSKWDLEPKDWMKQPEGDDSWRWEEKKAALIKGSKQRQVGGKDEEVRLKDKNGNKSWMCWKVELRGSMNVGRAHEVTCCIVGPPDNCITLLTALLRQKLILVMWFLPFCVLILPLVQDSSCINPAPILTVFSLLLRFLFTRRKATENILLGTYRRAGAG